MSTPENRRTDNPLDGLKNAVAAQKGAQETARKAAEDARREREESEQREGTVNE